MAGFDAYGVSSSDGKKESNVDFDALNKYVVDMVDCKDPETYNGYVSCIVDLGTQKQPDGEYNVDEGDESLSVEELTEKYQQEIEDGKITKFALSYDNDVKAKVIKKFVPQKDRQSFVYAVDFPDIQLDKGQFFGDDSGETKSLRLWSGGQFWNQYQGKMIVQNMIPLKVIKDDKVGWTMNPKSTTHKMAVASKLISKGEAFLPQEIDKLLGQTLQFEIQIFFSKGKNDKEYYNERIKFVGGIQKKDSPFTDVETKLIQFNQENDEQGLKEVRKHILNTISNATNFEGSAIQAQLKTLRPDMFKEDGSKPVANNVNTKVVVDDSKDDDWD